MQKAQRSQRSPTSPPRCSNLTWHGNHHIQSSLSFLFCSFSLPPLVGSPLLVSCLCALSRIVAPESRDENQPRHELTLPQPTARLGRHQTVVASQCSFAERANTAYAAETNAARIQTRTGPHAPSPFPNFPLDSLLAAVTATREFPAIPARSFATFHPSVQPFLPFPVLCDKSAFGCLLLLLLILPTVTERTFFL